MIKKGDSELNAPINSIIKWLVNYLEIQQSVPAKARQLTSAALRHGPVVRKREIK